MPEMPGGISNLIKTFIEEGLADVKELRREAQEATQDANMNLLMKAGEFAKKVKKNGKPLEKRMKGKVGRKVKPGEKEEKLSKEKRQQLDQKAKQFSENVSGLDANSLKSIREKISGESDAQKILDEIDKNDKYAKDPFLKDQILQFLIDDTEGDLQKACQEAQRVNYSENNRVIRQRRRLPKRTETDRKFSETYSEIVQEKADLKSIHTALKKRYQTKDLGPVCFKLLKSIAQENKEGPTIEKGKLHDIFEDIKHLQAISSTKKFFDSRMSLVDKMYAREGLSPPQHLNGELFFDHFLDTVSDRYFSAEKSEKIARNMAGPPAATEGIINQVKQKIIILTQMRDAVREVDPHRIFNSTQHRDDVYNAIIEALESLEDELEELEEQELE